jgi:hypothetical protein
LDTTEVEGVAGVLESWAGTESSKDGSLSGEPEVGEPEVGDQAVVFALRFDILMCVLRVRGWRERGREGERERGREGEREAC